MCFKKLLELIKKEETMPTTDPRATGVDISKWQGAFDDQGNLDFIIQKCSEGIYYDSRYWDMLPDVQEIERRGAYHYFRTAVSPIDQARFFNGAQGGQGFKWLVMDWEGRHNVLDEAGMDAFWIFYQELKSLTTKPIWLYCTEYAFRDLLDHNPQWIEVPFMVARYPGGDVDPQTDEPLFLDMEGVDWIAWQWEADGNGKGEEYGVSSEDIDMDVFNGTVADLDEHLGITDLPPVADCLDQIADAVAVAATEYEKKLGHLAAVHETDIIELKKAHALTLSVSIKKANNDALQSLIAPLLK